MRDTHNDTRGYICNDQHNPHQYDTISDQHNNKTNTNNTDTNTYTNINTSINTNANTDTNVNSDAGLNVGTDSNSDSGLSQEEISHLNEMAPELRDALLRLRKNIRIRQREKEQAAEARELNRLMGIKTPEDAAEEQRLLNLRRAMDEQERQNREAVRRKFLCNSGMEEAGIPLAFRTATMEAVSRRGIPEALEYPRMRICDYLSGIDKCCKSGTGLILTGPCGTLKTTFACSIMLEAFAHGIEARFELVMSMLDRLVMLEKANREEYSRTMHKLCTVPLLVLDDLGAEGHHADFVRSKLEQIVFQRHANNRALIITTNLSPQKLAGLYSGRIMDRLRERCLVLEHNCGSLRAKNVFSITA
ncbi:ATP-binding protein [Anaerovibrio sp.]|uniref:ATP-binding protein n=1 Tax=Anaerovibrio sp. TaxID=1872532 RepID=UPI003F15F604